VGTTVIVNKGLFMKSCPNVFLDRKGSGTKPPFQEGVSSQATGAVEQEERRGCQQ